MMKNYRKPQKCTLSTTRPFLEDDDIPRGKLLSRKEAMTVLAGAGACMLIGRAAFGQTDTCVVRPELTEGPYYLDDALERSDIRYDPTDDTIQLGAALNIAFVVTEVVDGVCVPLEDAIVEIWHCDAAGQYSGVSDAGFDTTGQVFLRGYQITDANGMVDFTTIYPGWYSGRAVHIHFKVRSNTGASTDFEFTSQLFFDDLVTDEVHSFSPYADKGYRDTLNERDNIYQGGGSQLLLEISDDGEGGYLTVFNIALELDGTSSGTIAEVAGVDCATPSVTTVASALSRIGVFGALLGIFAGLRPPQKGV